MYKCRSECFNGVYIMFISEFKPDSLSKVPSEKIKNDQAQDRYKNQYYDIGKGFVDIPVFQYYDEYDTDIGYTQRYPYPWFYKFEK